MIRRSMELSSDNIPVTASIGDKETPRLHEALDVADADVRRVGSNGLVVALPRLVLISASLSVHLVLPLRR